jgi:hypothetical protein
VASKRAVRPIDAHLDKRRESRKRRHIATNDAGAADVLGASVRQTDPMEDIRRLASSTTEQTPSGR